MNNLDPIQQAAALVGLRKLASELGVSYQAVRKWQTVGRMPRTEWTGETDYCARITALTGGQVTREMLLAKWPAAEKAAA